MTVTDSAAIHVKRILKQEKDSTLKLRVYIEGGGCSGFQYGFKLVDLPNVDDIVFDSNGISMVVDSVSAEYLRGSTLDFKKTLLSGNFVVVNPNASGQCGCGTSFAV